MGKQRENFEKRSNPPLNADGLRRYGAEFMARAQRINDIIRASADKLDEVDPAREITPVLSYLDVLFAEMEERVVKQVQAKCEAIHKVARLKAQNEK